jgi:rieske iron-sulfur protein
LTEATSTSSGEAAGTDKACGVDPIRRCLLQAGAAAALALLPGGARADDDDPRRSMRPQIGDVLVYGPSDQEGTVIKSSDVKVGDGPVLAWAMDPAQKVVRDGSRLNQVLLLRLDPAVMGPETAEHAADGLVAYSAICTHAQCTVTDWMEDRKVLHCPCHQSEYDPRQNAKVVGGPAPRALAALPLKLVDGTAQVAGLFIGRVGMDKQMM